VQSAAYWTIIGRIDQFTLGVVGFLCSREIANRPHLVLATVIAFVAFWWWFDASGGFFLRPSYPSPSALWIYLPTVEGLAYAVLIAWYDARAVVARGFISRLAQKLGEYSYSIYLLHFFVVFRAADYLNRKVLPLDNIYIAAPCALLLFVAMVVPGYLSFKFIEGPFLRLRRPYVRPLAMQGGIARASALS
jgi:peptidoglycan/LPS O-acetylase OafA/YrhL